MKRSQMILLTLFLCLHRPDPVMAWGANGHRIITETAFALLTPVAKQRILAILNGYPIDDAATWMDSVRINHVRQFKNMSSWHFLNMDPGQTYATAGGDTDVVYNLDRVVQRLTNGAAIQPDSAFFYIKVLCHLMGDITQPLHVGYGYDIGGNTVEVQTTKFNRKGLVLHAVWDDVIIEEGKLSETTTLAACNQFTQAQQEAIYAGSAQDWMMQARSYLPAVYNFTLVNNGVSKLPPDYLDNNVPVVQQQLAYAAVRLAHILNVAFA